MTMSNPLLSTALHYLQNRGWGPLPIRPKDKSPLVRWAPYQTQLPDEATVKSWFVRWPDANLGLACGAVSKLCVLDIDGEEGFITLSERGYHIPETLTATTGRGKHYYFQHPNQPTSNFVWGRRGLSLPCVDFRGDGGYVVAPPSLHVSGKRYSFEQEDCPVAQMPQWLRELVIQKPEPLCVLPTSNIAKRVDLDSIADRILHKAIDRAQPGTRNINGFEMCLQLRDNGLSEQEAVLNALLYAKAVASRGTHPYTEEEAIQSVRQAFSQPPRKPWSRSVSADPTAGARPAEPARIFAAAETNWPNLDEAAYHGLLGRAVKLIEPHTETDPVALLASLISEIGTMLNRAPHLDLDGSYHPLLFWPVLVGQSSKSRKGTADKRCRTLLLAVDSGWARGELKGTLSSGEGLAYAVRDPQYKREPVREKGKPTGEYEEVMVDSGVEDKRLFLVQSEFGAVLRTMARDGNSLSGVLRDAWDGQDLAPMTKTNRVKATNPHVGIVGHVTKDELLRNLTETDTSNGFGNRFVWLAVRRSKELPFPSSPNPEDVEALALDLRRAIIQARTLSLLVMNEPARGVWKAMYSDLSKDRPGMAGSLLNRAEAQVMRLAGLYAVLDGTALIDVIHLQAAMAFWEYAEASTKMIFGDNLGDAVADTILRGLSIEGELDDTGISKLFNRNVSAARLSQAKSILVSSGLIVGTKEETEGRHRTMWRRLEKSLTN
jgi:hypothetical protein